LLQAGKVSFAGKCKNGGYKEQKFQKSQIHKNLSV
jgi:hypothetical protein